MSRLRIATVVAALLALFAVAGCGGPQAQPRDADQSGFDPVTVPTVWGETTLTKKPQRIVALDVSYLDMLAAIDERPIAFSARTWTAADIGEQVPWITGLYEPGQFDPAMSLGAAEISAEAVAAHQPDLILASKFSVPEDQFEAFSKIAPTYVGRDADRNTDWQDYLTDVGTLTGKSDQASAAISEVDRKYAAAAGQLGGLQGKTFNFVTYRPEKADFGFTGAAWPQNFGLVPAENQPEPYVIVDPLSQENIDRLAADVLFIGARPREGYRSPDEQRAELEKDPRYAELPAVRTGSVFFVDREVGTAGSFAPGPHSISWLIDRVTPELAALGAN